MTGRYAAQGAGLRLGLELWAKQGGHDLAIEDDQSSPEQAARIYFELARHGCDFVLAPYGGDCTRAVARLTAGAAVWNHGAAADDVQQMAGVVSVCSPASLYLVALARAVAGLCPGARITVVSQDSPFGRLARDGLMRCAQSLGVTIAQSLSFAASPDAVATGSDAVLCCGSFQRELKLLQRLHRLRAPMLLGGVAPGLEAFASHLGADPEGILAVCQWHPELELSPTLGPPSSQVLAAARREGAELDYIGAQAYAAALIAARAHELSASDPLAAARGLAATTFYGGFGLDPDTGIQRAHRLCVIRWHDRRQQMLQPA